MEQYYSDNKNHQILLSLLKAHGVRTIVASPGGTNPALVASLQYDEFFTLYSCVDERSAAYMACGLAEESGEAVAICCTGATASRNYYPALTEAFYRRLPIIVLTCSRPNYNIGQLMPQVTNRSQYPADILVCGEQLQEVRGPHDVEDCIYKVNKVLIKARQRGGGPVHLNLETITQKCSTQQLPEIKAIHYVGQHESVPQLPTGKIGIFIGSHKPFSVKVQSLIESFCEEHNAVVFTDHTSGYYGKYRVQFALIGCQRNAAEEISNLDLLIHLGEVSGDYYSIGKLNGKEVWRVNEDGEIRIRFNHLEYLFDMDEEDFFTRYTDVTAEPCTTFYEHCHDYYHWLYQQIPLLPLSHLSIAHKLAPLIPADSTLHPAIMNALRSWNFFEVPPTVRTNCNVGGFGIDGCVSTLIGASWVHPDHLYFSFVGDLAFFYDLNSLGNRHIGPNVRILLLNDNGGTEFRHAQFQSYEVGSDDYIAAVGHNGQQSKALVRDFAQNLGFEYLTASTTDEFSALIPHFLQPEVTDRPILLEVFSTAQNQSDAWQLLRNLAPEQPVPETASPTLTDKVGRLFKRFLK